MKNKRKHLKRNKSDWREIYEEHQNSNQSMSSFCKLHSIPTSSYAKWKQIFDSEVSPEFKKLSPLTSLEKCREFELELPEGIKLRLSF